MQKLLLTFVVLFLLWDTYGEDQNILDTCCNYSNPWISSTVRYDYKNGTVKYNNGSTIHHVGLLYQGPVYNQVKEPIWSILPGQEYKESGEIFFRTSGWIKSEISNALRIHQYFIFAPTHIQFLGAQQYECFCPDLNEVDL